MSGMPFSLMLSMTRMANGVVSILTIAIDEARSSNLPCLI